MKIERLTAWFMFWCINLLFLGILPSLFIWGFGFYSCEIGLRIVEINAPIEYRAVILNNWFLIGRTLFLAIWATVLTAFGLILKPVVIRFFKDL